MEHNPIQQVLQAERAAQERIEQARRDAENVVSAARRRAKDILERNDDRTKRVLTAYEQRWNAELERKSEDLKRAAVRELEASKNNVDHHFDQIVAATFEESWPG